MRFVSTMMLAAVPALAATQAINIAWLPVTDAEREMKQPVVEKGAGVEAIFWRVHVVDEVTSSGAERALYNYVRLKIFTEEGKKKASTIDVPYGEKTSILAIAGRTNKADGSVVELGHDAIHDRVLVRAGGIKRNAKSFAMPGVEVGSIVEYRWKEVRWDARILYLRISFQREYPVQRVTYFLKPLESAYVAYRMAIMPFNCKPTPFTLEHDGFNSTTVENVPAFREEPMMPGEGSVRPWALIYYHNDGKREPEKYWSGVGKEIYGELKQALKTSGDLKQAAAEAVVGAKDDNDKVVRLIRYVRAHVRDLYGRDVTEAERSAVLKKMPKDRFRNASEIFHSGLASSDEMNTLFAALANQVGLDARPAMVANRDDFLFDERLTERYFLRNIDMAVLIDDKWKLYDVSANLLPPGMLGWREEGSRALVTDPKKPQFVTSPISPPEASLSSRTAKLELAEDGTVEGDVEEIRTGHLAHERRLDFYGESQERQTERLKDEITKAYPQSELSELKIENGDNAEQPLKLSYHIKIPGYAQRTGKRIFFHPVFFERNSAPLFSATDRTYDIFFRYAWHEMDKVTISLPPNFELEKPENPGGMAFGKPGYYDLKMMLNGGKELVCIRDLVFGMGEQLFFPRAGYQQIKNVFDEVQRRDNHMLALRQSGAGL